MGPQALARRLSKQKIHTATVDKGLSELEQRLVGASTVDFVIVVVGTLPGLYRTYQGGEHVVRVEHFLTCIYLAVCLCLVQLQRKNSYVITTGEQLSRGKFEYKPYVRKHTRFVLVLQLVSIYIQPTH